MKKIALGLMLISTISIIFLIPLQAEVDDLKVKVGAYIDTYIATDNEKFDILKRSGRLFAVVDNTKNEFELNVAQLSANIDYHGQVRGVFVLQAGSLLQNAFLSYEPKTQQANIGTSIQQANIGVNIVKGLWLDAGYFLTHIGAESLLPKDNWLSSHSMVTFYEPFFQSGVRLSYEFDQFTAQLHILNQNGAFEDHNQNKTYGLYFKYNGGDMIQASYAGCYGNEEPSGSTPKTQMLHNIVLESHPIKDLGIKATFDLATKEKSKLLDSITSKYADGTFTGYSLQAKYNFTDAISLTGRFSGTNNTDNVYVPIIGVMGLKGTDITIGAEYKPTPYSYIRFEYRMLNFNAGSSKEGNVFIDKNNKPINTRNDIMLNFGVWLD